MLHKQQFVGLFHLLFAAVTKLQFASNLRPNYLTALTPPETLTQILHVGRLEVKVIKQVLAAGLVCFGVFLRSYCFFTAFLSPWRLWSEVAQIRWNEKYYMGCNNRSTPEAQDVCMWGGIEMVRNFFRHFTCLCCFLVKYWVVLSLQAYYRLTFALK